jgi:hypothetical protein
MLAIDPLGIVGDGGRQAFETELEARTPKEGRARLHELEEKEKTAKLTADEQDEIDAITWPAYFADPENVVPMPPFESREEVFTGLASELMEGLVLAGAPARWSCTSRWYEVSAWRASSSSAVRMRSLVDQIPAARRVYLAAPAVISRRRSFLRVSEGCWWA